MAMAAGGHWLLLVLGANINGGECAECHHFLKTGKSTAIAIGHDDITTLSYSCLFSICKKFKKIIAIRSNSKSVLIRG